MLPKKGFTYKCKMNFNQYVKDEIYKCVQDGYLEVNGLNYRIQDENFFEGYFSIHKTLVYWHTPKDINGNDFNIEPLTTFSKNLTKDKIVLQVMEDLNSRSRVGIEKYNTTLERTDLELKDWLLHAYEECLDQANYLKRAIIEIENNQS